MLPSGHSRDEDPASGLTQWLHGTWEALDLRVDSKAYPAFMATTMRIAEVADRSGLSPATLRYYEKRDLLPEPQRNRRLVPGLRRVGPRPPRLHRQSEDTGLFAGGDRRTDAPLGRRAMRPVQDRLRELVTAKLTDTQARVAELETFTADVRRIRVDLGSHTPDGPCDSDCGRLSDSSTPRRLEPGRPRRRARGLHPRGG